MQQLFRFCGSQPDHACRQQTNPHEAVFKETRKAAKISLILDRTQHGNTIKPRPTLVFVASLSEMGVALERSP